MNEIHWNCPHCKCANADYRELTARPLCEECFCDFAWSAIAPDEDFDPFQRRMTEQDYRERDEAMDILLADPNDYLDDDGRDSH